MSTHQDLTDFADAFDEFRDLLTARGYDHETATEIAASALPFIADIVEINKVGEEY